MIRPTLMIALIITALAVPAVATPPQGGGSTPAEAYERLQKAAAARDIVAMAAVLDPDNRALLLRDLFANFALLNGGFEGIPERKGRTEKLGELIVNLIKPALVEHPIDPVYVSGRSDDEQVLLVFAWGISKLSLSDALVIARELASDFAKIDHPRAREAIDLFADQVPKGALKITRQMETAAWAEADARPLGFKKNGERWFASGVWYTKVTVPIGAGASEGPATAPGEGAPLNAISAYALLAGIARVAHPGARLRELQSGIYPIDATGAAAGWFAQFLTDKPGELVSMSYIDGNASAPATSEIWTGAKSIPDEAEITFDLERAFEIARKRAAVEHLPQGTKTTASLVRGSSSGIAQWVLNTYGSENTVLWTIILDAKTLEVTHVSK